MWHARTPLSRAKNRKNKWAEWLGQGERKGDKGAMEFCPSWNHQPGQKDGLCSRLVAPIGTKRPCPPHPPRPGYLLDPRQKPSLVPGQRQPGQMAWNKGLFCSSDTKPTTIERLVDIWKFIYFYLFHEKYTESVRCSNKWVRPLTWDHASRTL